MNPKARSSATSSSLQGASPSGSSCRRGCSFSLPLLPQSLSKNSKRIGEKGERDNLLSPCSLSLVSFCYFCALPLSRRTSTSSPPPLEQQSREKQRQREEFLFIFFFFLPIDGRRQSERRQRQRRWPQAKGRCCRVSLSFLKLRGYRGDRRLIAGVIGLQSWHREDAAFEGRSVNRRSIADGSVVVGGKTLPSFALPLDLTPLPPLPLSLSPNHFHQPYRKNRAATAAPLARRSALRA